MSSLHHRPRRHRLPTHALAVSALAALLSGCGLPALTATLPGAQPHASTTLGESDPGSATGVPGTSSAPGTSRTSTVLTTPAQARLALAQLDRLPVKGRAPKTGYARDRFGPSWTDDVDVAGGHNGCDTRNDVLRRDLTDERL